MYRGVLQPRVSAECEIYRSEKYLIKIKDCYGE